MFGFLTAPCSGCRGREHSVYRAHFCGLCNRLRRDYGLPMRFLVNRDATFLSILGQGLATHAAPLQSDTCCNPLGKPRPVVQEGEPVSYAAAVTLCGLKAKLDDEVTDRAHRPTGTALRGVRGMLKGPVFRAETYLNQRGFPVESVRRALGTQAELERQATASRKPDLEELSRPSAFSLGQILAHAGGRAQDSLERIGQSLGRMIYILDAVGDRKRDEINRQFNPFLLQPALIHTAPDLLKRDLHTIGRCIHELPLQRHREVLDVILGRNLEHTCHAMVEGNHPPRSTSTHPGQQKNTGKKKSNSCCEGWCDGASWCDVCLCGDCGDCGDADGCLDCGCDCDVCCCDCT